MNNQNPTPVTFILKRTEVTIHAVTVIDDGSYRSPVYDYDDSPWGDALKARACDLLDEDVDIELRPGERVRLANDSDGACGSGDIEVLASFEHEERP